MKVCYILSIILIIATLLIQAWSIGFRIGYDKCDKDVVAYILSQKKP